jgi:multicomponent K+:H+ antiporter subunit E
MSRLLPMPALSLVMLAAWLLLWQSLAPLDVLTGAVLALLLPRTLLLLGGPPSRAKRPLVMLRLFFVVLYDIAMSNLAVAIIVLTSREQAVPTGFVNIPLELENRHGLAVLAAIITATPGTFWASYNRRTNVLIIHVFNLTDEERVRATIKGRYEAPLKEIFG